MLLSAATRAAYWPALVLHRCPEASGGKPLFPLVLLLKVEEDEALPERWGPEHIAVWRR